MDGRDAALAALFLDDLIADRPSWMADGLCREYPDVEFFPPRSAGSSAVAYAICERCLVRRECAVWAFARPDIRGIWGGTTFQSRGKARVAGLDVDELLDALDARRVRPPAPVAGPLCA